MVHDLVIQRQANQDRKLQTMLYGTHGNHEEHSILHATQPMTIVLNISISCNREIAEPIIFARLQILYSIEQLHAHAQELSELCSRQRTRHLPTPNRTSERQKGKKRQNKTYNSWASQIVTNSSTENRSEAYRWQSGRGAEFSLVCGRM